MSAFRPESYAEALSLAQNRPQKRRAPLKRGSMDKPRAVRHRAAIARDTVPRKRTAKAKKLSDGKWKKKVWKEFSIFIRTRGADEHGFNRCVTCIVKKHWKELQAGHFIRGRLNANLFDERGVNPQCYICNVHFQGNVVVYYGWMLAKHGQAVIDELIQQNNQTKKWAPGELQELLHHYKSRNDANPLIERKAKNSLRDRTVERP